MFGITDLYSYIIGSILIVMLPGPNSIYVMSIASRFGIKTGYQAALGVFTGDLILIIFTVLGAASLLHAFPWLFVVLKVVGASYLSYLGVRLCIAAYKTWRKNSAERPSTTASSESKLTPYRTALTISLLNPKAILFFLSFFIQFVDPHYPYPAISFAILAVLVQIISMSYLSLLIFSGFKMAQYFSQHYKVAAAGVAVIGVLFCFFGFKLATSTLS